MSNKIQLSFLDGPKIEITGNKPADYRCEFIDDDSGLTIYSTTIRNNHWCAANLKYYLNWRVKVHEGAFQIVNHRFELTGKKVYIQIDSSALGDTLAWIPYLEEFQQIHNCKVSACTHWNHILESAYPDLMWLAPESGCANPSQYEAAYHVGTFDNDYNKNRNNWRFIPLQQVASDLLGLPRKEIRPKVSRSEKARPIAEKYVSLAEFSTFQGKLWNYPGGWQELVDWFNASGHRVMSVSREPTQLKNIIPANGRPIEETINNIQHAEFHIGVASGLIWLAWALGTKPVVISGFTEPYSEMTDCIRVINKDVCHGCYNDQHIQFDRGNWRLCPRNMHFECSTKITPHMVEKALQPLVGGVLVHTREKNREMDMEIVREVLENDGYRLGMLKSQIPEPKVVVDVGGHIGTFGMKIKALWPDVKLIAYEPNAESADLYRKNMERFSNWIVEKKAIAYDKTKRLLADDSRCTGGGILIHDGDLKNGQLDLLGINQAGRYMISHTNVEADTLEEIIEKHGLEQIDILKLDCESSEIEIIREMKSETAAKIRRIIGEYHCIGYSDFAALLRTKGFEAQETRNYRPTQGMFAAQPMLAKIRIVHLLNNVDDEIDRGSINSLKPLTEFGIEYVQQFNAMATHLPALNSMRPTNVWGEPLKPGYYGNWAAHRRAIEEEFTDEVDCLLICERDCALDVSPGEFARKIHSYLPPLKAHQVALHSFGPRINPATGYEESKLRKEINGEIFIADQIIQTHCVLIPASSRDFLLEQFRTEGWYSADLWYNAVFEKAGMPVSIGYAPLATQHDGGQSLIDGEKPQLQSEAGGNKVLMVLHHCSTGGMPQYALKCVEDLKAAGGGVEVVEINYVSDQNLVQRKRLQGLVPFHSLNGNKVESIRKIIDAFHPGTIHVQESPEYWDGTPETKALAQEIYRSDRHYKIVETTHGTWLQPEGKRYLPDAFAFVSNYHKRKFAPLGIPSEVVEYMLPKRDRPNRAEALKMLGLDPGKKHVLSVGIFTPGKNQGEAFEIARKLPDIQFHFVGSQADNFREYWQPLMTIKPSNCTVWGEREDVDNFYAAMDLFLFTSRSELNPLVIKEAGSWGMPIFMRDLPTYDSVPADATTIDDDLGRTCRMIRGLFPTMAATLARVYRETVPAYVQ